MSDTLLNEIARSLYRSVLDGSSGYVEGREAWVNLDPTCPAETVIVDSPVCFYDLANDLLPLIRTRIEAAAYDTEMGDDPGMREMRSRWAIVKARRIADAVCGVDDQ